MPEARVSGDLGRSCSISARDESVRSFLNRLLNEFDLELDYIVTSDWRHPAIFPVLGYAIESPLAEHDSPAHPPIADPPPGVDSAALDREVLRTLRSKLVDLSFTDEPLPLVLAVIAERTGLSIRAEALGTTAEDRRITLRVEGFPADKSLDLVARMHSLAWVILAGEVIVHAPEETADILSDRTESEPTPEPTRLTSLGTNAQGHEEYRHERTGIVLVRMRPTDEDLTNRAGGRRSPLTAGTPGMTVPGPFLLGKTEVTNAQFRRFARLRKYDPVHSSGHFRGHDLDADEQPVGSIPARALEAYLRWAGLRLPSAHEWLWAAGEGNGPDFGWGEDWPPPMASGNLADEPALRLGWWGGVRGRDDGFAVTAPVGRFPPNAFGLYDLSGNVWEICSDGAARGGAWSEFRPSRLLLGGTADSVGSNAALGFRVALDLPVGK